jgi:hypothetical protein
MTESLHCWHCNKALVDVILPMSRREECSHCGFDQHVCKMCEYFEPKFRGSCNEERAEAVSDAEKANFCDYFLPKSGGFISPAQQKALDAKRQLAELFGETPESEDEEKEQAPLSKAELAKQKLKDLFGE